MATQDPRKYETVLTLSTGATMHVRESVDDVVKVFGVARKEGAAGLLSLTNGEGQQVYLVVGHVVAIAPHAPDPATLSPELVEGLQQASRWSETQ